MSAPEPFLCLPLSSGLLFDDRVSDFPSRLHGWTPDGGTWRPPTEERASWFGYVHEGPAEVRAGDNTYTLHQGQYFCFQSVTSVVGGRGVIFEREGQLPMNVVGGPLESTGRLRYMNGCSDSLLIPPVKRGYACLNALYFPRNIDQQPHTHPSVRLGIVVRGSGVCRLPTAMTPLARGDLFVIRENTIHSFRTASHQTMVVVAYHPDSYFGPEDQHHPMINRTLVDGTPASELQHLERPSVDLE